MKVQKFKKVFVFKIISYSDANDDCDETVPLLNAAEHNQPLRYPKRVFLIIGTEFCERFNFCGMKSKIIVLNSFFLDRNIIFSSSLSQNCSYLIDVLKK